jgi:[acyl-carrier-protein] S-malonyltransferase
VQVHPEADAVRAALSGQLWRPVRWSACIEKLAAAGVERFVECGPGKVLTGLNRRIVRGAEAFALNSQDAVNELIGQGSGA